MKSRIQIDLKVVLKSHQPNLLPPVIFQWFGSYSYLIQGKENKMKTKYNWIGQVKDRTIFLAASAWALKIFQYSLIIFRNQPFFAAPEGIWCYLELRFKIIIQISGICISSASLNALDERKGTNNKIKVKAQNLFGWHRFVSSKDFEWLLKELKLL